MNRKVVILSAPSGAGKTTLVKHLLSEMPRLEFSISACSRKKRENETDGKDYYFLAPEEFRNRIEKDEFVEWEEVYSGCYYGTLKSELERIWSMKKIPVFDVDVYGGLNLKKFFQQDALAIFIQPPSPEILEKRLRERNSDDEESLRKRLAKAAEELNLAKRFDQVVVNDDLTIAKSKVTNLVTSFLT